MLSQLFTCFEGVLRCLKSVFQAAGFCFYTGTLHDWVFKAENHIPSPPVTIWSNCFHEFGYLTIYGQRARKLLLLTPSPSYMAQRLLVIGSFRSRIRSQCSTSYSETDVSVARIHGEYANHKGPIDTHRESFTQLKLNASNLQRLNIITLPQACLCISH